MLFKGKQYFEQKITNGILEYFRLVTILKTKEMNKKKM